MDRAHTYNRARWEALADAGALFARPWLDLDPASARCAVDPTGHVGDVHGKDVLCLAGGGGQQSAAFALLGARVTVIDIAEGQLEGDRAAARHYAVEIATHQSDMRDLSVFSGGSFDVVSQPYSINFVPDCRVVFAEVARVLRPGGIYSFAAANPFAAGIGTRSWTGRGYEVSGAYEQGAATTYADEAWVFPDAGDHGAISGPTEYRQLLSTMLNGLLERGFTLVHLREETRHASAVDPDPGTWEHLVGTMPPWLHIVAMKASGLE